MQAHMQTCKTILMYCLLDTADGSLQRSVELPGFAELGCEDYWFEDPVLAFAPEGGRLDVGWWHTLLAVDLSSGSIEQRELRHNEVVSLNYVDGLLAVVTRDYAERFSLEIPASLEVFDSSLKALWSWDEPVHTSYDSYGNVFRCKLAAVGSWSYHGGDDLQLVVPWGSELLLLDETSGEEVQRLSCDSAFLGAAVMEIEGRMRVMAATSDGTLMCRAPREANSGHGGTGDDVSLGLGSLRSVEFEQVDGRVFCSVWTEMQEKRRVYRYWSVWDLPDAALFGDGYQTTDLQYAQWGRELVTLQMSDELLFLDGQTLEVRSHVPLSDLDQLYPDQYADAKVVVSLAGDCYLAGDAQPRTEGERGMVVYRIDPSDASHELIMRVDGLFTLHQLDRVAEDDGTERLLLTCYFGGADHVVLLDPDDIENEASYVDIELPDVRRVWYGEGRLVAFCNGSLLGGNASFCLVDLETGELVDCDLDDYALRNAEQYDRCSCLAYDCTTFAVACGDGLLRLFDTQTGALCWETDQVPGNARLVQMTTEGNVFVQDELGRCMLVSGATGEVLQASSVTMPVFKTALHRVSDNTMVAYFVESSLLSRSGIAVVALDEDAFGPLSIVYGGLVFSNDNRRFICEDSLSSELYLARRLDIDELREQAKALVAGHELTDAERHLFHVSR